MAAKQNKNDCDSFVTFTGFVFVIQQVLRQFQVIGQLP